MQTVELLLTKLSKRAHADPVLSVLVQHSLSCRKTWVDCQIPEPYAIIKPIIYLSFLVCMKNIKNNGLGQYAD